MGVKLNLTGNKFNKLLAICPVNKTSNGSYRWKFKCDCGNETVSVGYQVKSGWIRSCGCLRKTKNKFVSVAKRIFVDYRYKAKIRNLKFNLSFKNFTQLLIGQCHYCGATPRIRQRTWKTKVNGIDRKNNKLGYSKNNCVTCCIVCNRAKGKLSYKEFTEWILRIKTMKNLWENLY